MFKLVKKDKKKSIPNVLLILLLPAANAIQGLLLYTCFFFVPAFKIDLIRGFQCNYIII